MVVAPLRHFLEKAAAVEIASAQGANMLLDHGKDQDDYRAVIVMYNSENQYKIRL